MMSFPNRLFDLYTVNKLTSEIISDIAHPSVSPIESLDGDLNFPVIKRPGSAYCGGVPFRRFVPDEIDEILLGVGFRPLKRYFINYHPVPPRYEPSVDAETLKSLKIAKESDLESFDWRDQFSHSTFMTAHHYVGL